MKEARRRTPSTEIEQALVDAAFHLLEAEGPEALSVRRVAAEAGVAPMGVYNHFDGKNGVVDAIFRAGFAALTAELTDLGSYDDPLEGLKEGLRRYRRLALDHPRTYEVMFFCSIPGYEPSEEAHAEATTSFEVLAKGIERGISAGLLAEGDPYSIAQQLWAACHGAVALEIVGIGKADDMGAVYEQLLDTLVRGLSAAPADRPGSPARGGRPARAR